MAEEQKEVVKEIKAEEVTEEVTPTEEQETALRQERITACNQELSVILKKYGCTLDASVVLRAGQVMPNIQIVPVELMKKEGPAIG